MVSLQHETWGGASWLWTLRAATGVAAAWAALLAAKLVLGFALKRAARAYVDHYDAHAKSR